MTKENILKIDKGYISKVGDILSQNNIYGKFLFITDPVVDGLYGKDIKEQLRQLGIIDCRYIYDNSISHSMSLAENIITSNINYVVGVGGGKVLDVCKYSSYISKKLFISIPTTLANDSIASPIAVLKKSDLKPTSLGCAIPSVIIIDTDIIYNSPVNLTKAGIGDTISNYMALLDWDFACEKKQDEMNDFAYLISRNSLEALMMTQFDKICPEFIHVLANSIVLSGIAMDFAGSSRPVSGSEHLFSHALDYYCKAENLHGIQVALGTISILKLMGFHYDHLLDYLNRFEVNINPKMLGISKKEFIDCMQKATSMRLHRYTYLHEFNLETKILSKLYDELEEEL